MEIKMEARLPQNISNLRDLLLGASVAKSQAEMSSSVALVKNIEAPDTGNKATTDRDRKTRTEMSEQTAELLSMLNREVKFEILDDAGVVQIQVIDAGSGRVVRKIPADEVVRLLELMREQVSFDDGVEVWA